MIQKSEFGWTGSISDIPAWGTEPEMAQAAVLVSIPPPDVRWHAVKDTPQEQKEEHGSKT